MTPNSCFGAFHTIWVHLGPLGCLTKLGAKRAERAKVRATKSRQNFSRRTHSIHSIGPLNSCFGAFCTIWVFLRPFCCLTKLGVKRSELVQKFVPRTRVGIFRNESTPWDPKLKFLCISYHLDPFGTVRLPYETQGKMGRTSAKDRATKSSRIFFRNKPTQSTPLDPKLMFWCILYHFDAFATIWLPCETRDKTFRTTAKVRATKSCRNFSQRKHPVHPMGP